MAKPIVAIFFGHFMALLSKNRLFQVFYSGVEALFQPELADLSNISDDGLFVG